MTDSAVKPSVGHNSKAILASAVERIERLDEEIKAIAEDRKEVFTEVKDLLDLKVLRHVLRRRKMDAGERDELDMSIEEYEALLG